MPPYIGALLAAFFGILSYAQAPNVKRKGIFMEDIKVTNAILVALAPNTQELESVERSLDELERLLDTAGGTTAARMVQVRQTPEAATYIGSGKLEELSELCQTQEAQLAIFDCELSPSQIRNIEDALEGDVRVIDRSMLILDIFALHATTGEGKLQVELAQLKYSAPRLMGHGKDMSRLGGGIGTRGPGESKLESDRRHMKRRIDALEEELERLEKNRRTMRTSRERSGMKKIAIVGYTNAGKSTLLNRLTDAGILAEDKLFATLDPTTRRFTLPCGEEILLTDTVGFIRKLPHHLIQAFKSTLDEAVCADILLIIIDSSDPECREQLKVTEDLLSELGASGKPTLYVFNKCDLGISDAVGSGIQSENIDAVYISAATGQGIDSFVAKLEEKVLAGKKKVTYLFPHTAQSMLNILYNEAVIESCDYIAEGTRVCAVVDERTRGRLAKFEV